MDHTHVCGRTAAASSGEPRSVMTTSDSDNSAVPVDASDRTMVTVVGPSCCRSSWAIGSPLLLYMPA